MNSATAARQRSPVTSPIAAGDVPILRISHERISELSRRRSTALSHLQSLIEGDPGVALNLFTEVNKKLKGCGRALAADVPRAVLFMGPEVLIRRIAQAPILESLANDDQTHGLRRLLGRAHHASRQARSIGRLLGGICNDEILAASLTREALAYVEGLSKLPGNTLDADKIRGLLPSPLDGHDIERVSISCMDLAARFATATDESWDEAVIDPIFEEVAELSRRSPEDVARAMKDTIVAAAREGKQFEIYPAAIYLMSPGPRRKPSTSRSQQPKPTADLRDTQSNKGAAIAPKQVPSAKAGRAIEDPTNGLDRAFKHLQNAAKNGKSAAEILPFSLRMICEHVDVQLAVLLLYDKRTGHLAVRLHHGLRLPDQLIGHAIDPLHNPLFERLLKAQSAFHCVPDKHKNSLAKLPLKLLGNNDGLLFSVHVEDKPIGIIMACRPSGTNALGIQQFKIFQRFCKATSRALALSRQHSRPTNRAPQSE